MILHIRDAPGRGRESFFHQTGRDFFPKNPGDKFVSSKAIKADLILLNVLRPECFLRAHSWLNWVDEDDDEVGLKEKPEDTRYIKKITSK